MNEISFSYNKLWKLLIDRGMKKKDLQGLVVLALLQLLNWAGMVMLR